MSEKRFDTIEEFFRYTVDTGLFAEFQKEAKGVIEKMKEDGRLDGIEKEKVTIYPDLENLSKEILESLEEENESCDCSSEGFLDLEIDGEEPKEGFFEKLAGIFKK